MTPGPATDPELERQHAQIDADFRAGWVPKNAGEAQPLPFINHVGDADVIITGSGAQQRVAVLFSHEHFPGVRFGHRFPPPSGKGARYAPIWLKEEIETGALHRMMRAGPSADHAGVIWTAWGN
jgi:hypothetical protein